MGDHPLGSKRGQFIVTGEDAIGLLDVCVCIGLPSVPVNLIISQNSTGTTNNTSITVRLDWSPPLNNDGNNSYQVTVDRATEVMYIDDTMAFVTLNSSGQYLVNITALNCAGSCPALSGVINIVDTGMRTKDIQ